MYSYDTWHDIELRKHTLKAVPLCTLKVLDDCGLITDDEQFQILTDKLGFKQGEISYSDFLMKFEGKNVSLLWYTFNPGVLVIMTFTENEFSLIYDQQFIDINNSYISG